MIFKEKLIARFMIFYQQYVIKIKKKEVKNQIIIQLVVSIVISTPIPPECLYLN